MKLYGSTTSPFVRIIRIIAIELGIYNDIEFEKNSLLDEKIRNELTELHPLTKIPFLIDGNNRIAETRNIVDYLQEKSKNYSFMDRKGANHWQDEFYLLQIQGALEAGVLYFYENQNSNPNKAFLDKYAARVHRALSYLEKNTTVSKDELSLLNITLVATYSFLDFRMKEQGFFDNRPQLMVVIQNLLERKSFKDTKPYINT